MFKHFFLSKNKKQREREVIFNYAVSRRNPPNRASEKFKRLETRGVRNIPKPGVNTRAKTTPLEPWPTRLFFLEPASAHPWYIKCTVIYFRYIAWDGRVRNSIPSTRAMDCLPQMPMDSPAAKLICMREKKYRLKHQFIYFFIKAKPTCGGHHSTTELM